MSNLNMVPPTLPNPETSLAWLEPGVAAQLEASRYLYCAVVGAWIWELFMSFPQEVRICSRRKLGSSDLVYVLAKISSAAYILCAFVFQLGPVGDCQRLETVLAWFGTCAVSFNCLLFFFRVRAVFHRSLRATLFFGLLWLATLGCTMTAAFGLTAGHIGTTSNCIDVAVQSYTSSGFVAAAVNDTVVFLAISYRLISISFTDTWSERLNNFFRGQHMNHVSRVLLQTGQLYYFLTISMNIVSMVVILTPSVPPIIRAMFTVPSVALQNTMACRVYRLLKLDVIRDVFQPSTLQSNNFHLPYILKRRNTFDGSQARRTNQSGNPGTFTSSSTTQYNTMSTHIEIRKEVEVDTGSSERLKFNSLE